MSSGRRSFLLTQRIHDYLAEHGPAVDEHQRALIEESARMGNPGMQVGADQGALMTLLARISGARDAIEIGTYIGYSALCIARGLPEDGTLICCDLSAEWTSIGRRQWDAAGVGHKIQVRIGPAIDTLRSLPRRESFDFAFIDADKAPYVDYYEELAPRMRPGGLILADNVLSSGRVVDPTENGDSTRSIRRFNDRVRDDPRVESMILPIGDGLTLARKR